MRSTQRTRDGVTVLELAEEFTYSTRKLLSGPVDGARQTGCRHLILDLQQVTFMDSAAPGLLALTAQQFIADKKQLSLVGPQGTVKQVLDLSNISQLIPVYATEQAAIRGGAA